MAYRVVVWGTGNAGRPAIRAVAAHADLELVGVVVSNPDKVGRDAGELAYLEPLRVTATDDVGVALSGFGGPMDTMPMMLLDIALEMVWAPMVRILAEALGVELEAVRTHVERRPLERTVEVPGMGTFEAGTQGAFRFEVQGIVDGRPLL